MKSRCQSFKFILSGVSSFQMLSLQTSNKLQNDLDLKTAECNDLNSCLDLQKKKFEKQMKGALEKNSDFEKQLQDFEQKHGDLQEEFLLTKRKTKKVFKQVRCLKQGL